VRLIAHRDTVFSLAALPASAGAGAGAGLVCSGGFDGSVVVWDPSTLQPLRTLRLAAPAPAPGALAVRSLAAWGPAALAAGYGDGLVRVWDRATWRCYEDSVLRGHSAAVNALCAAAAPGAGAGAGLPPPLLSGSADGTVRQWAWQEGDRRGGWPGEVVGRHEASVECLAVWGDCWLSGSMDRTVAVWSPAAGRRVATLAGHAGGVAALAVDAAGGRLYSGGWDQTIRCWALGTWERLRTVQACDPLGNHFVSCLGLAGRELVSRVWAASGGRL
jgi:WD40 repeat protein